MLTGVVFLIINIGFLKTNGGRNGIERLEDMILGSFNFLSGGDGGQRILGSQPGSASTIDLKESRL